ncbi:MAG: LptF/LptG family permease [Fuerstiella sp.]|nr:LptF/LptG family permease [Fuerstiella sp.]
MFTTFDRYLWGRMLHTFVVFFVATYGLYIVIDLFTNIDAFQMETEKASPTVSSAQSALATMVRKIALYYLYRSSDYLGLAGLILVSISTMAVLGLMEKNSESHPVLAAGIPAFRLLKPFLMGTAALNFLIICNQELIIPSIAVELQTPRGRDQTIKQEVIPVYDYSNHMMSIDGESVSVAESRLDTATFYLPPELAQGGCALRAESAIYLPANDRHPSGWILTNQTGVFDPKLLTDEGRKRIIPKSNGKDVFVASEVNFDELYYQGRNPKLLSSMQLVKRIRHPATGSVTVRQQSLALHSRVTKPLLSMMGAAIALPLILRKESTGLVINLAICSCVLAAIFGITEGSLLLGNAGLIRPELAAWLPVVFAGTTSVWTSGYVQT